MKNEHEHRVILKAASGEEAPLRVHINPRAKRILLRVDPKAKEGVAVAPSKRHIRQALAFAESRSDWVVKQVASLSAPLPLGLNTVVPVRGVEHQIVAKDTGRNISVDETEDGFRLCVPGDESAVPRKIIGYLKANARTDLSRQVRVHAERLNVKPNGIAIKDTRTRWGSCSSKGNLNFSWRLICAPPFVLDYVAAHECSHLLEMNHSSRFWRHVSHCIPDYQTAQIWLKKHGRSLHSIGD